MWFWKWLPKWLPGTRWYTRCILHNVLYREYRYRNLERFHR